MRVALDTNAYSEMCRGNERVLDTLKSLKSQYIVDLKSAAVVVRQADGKVKIKETSDFDLKQGAIGGAVAGGLLGLLRGNLLGGAIVGAAGGAAARQTRRRSWRR